MKATVVFHGDRGSKTKPHTSRTVVNGVTDKAAAVALGTALGGFTTCNVGRTSVVDYDGGDPSAPGVDANIDERGTIFMKDTDNDSVVRVEIPAWDKTAHPVESQSDGDRIAKADVDAIASAVATATGKNLTGLWGKHTKSS